MPEGPSIVILREELKSFKGKKVLKASGNAKIDFHYLEKKKIVDLRSWGKHFLIIFKDHFIRVHLLMFGKYMINERRDFEPRLLLQFPGSEFSFYSCSVKLLEIAELQQYDWRFDTMSDEWNSRLVLKSIRKQPDEMICDVLLDQEVFAGVGNIIKNEVLFICKVHPESLLGDLPATKLRQVVKTTREYCFDFYKWKKKFELRKHWQIYKKGKCTRCGSPLDRRHVGKRKRWTYICTNCQVFHSKS
jgi:endonuclease-8